MFVISELELVGALSDGRPFRCTAGMTLSGSQVVLRTASGYATAQ